MTGGPWKIPTSNSVVRLRLLVTGEEAGDASDVLTSGGTFETKSIFGN